jgi:hypothetical protein
VGESSTSQKWLFLSLDPWRWKCTTTRRSGRAAESTLVHDAHALQGLEALGQQGGRHQRDPAAEVVEARAAAQKLADHQRCPLSASTSEAIATGQN